MKELSLDGFITHLAAVAEAERVAARSALNQAAKVMEKCAKDKIGEYQEQAGPFIAWPDLAESTQADRVKQGYSEDEPGLRTGAMRDSIGTATSTDGLEAQIGSNDDHLVYFELGTEKQPPRSVLGGAMVESLPEIERIIGREVVAALVGEKVFEGKLMIEG